MSLSGVFVDDSSEDEEEDEEQLHTVGGGDSTPSQEVRGNSQRILHAPRRWHCTRGGRLALRPEDASRSSPQAAAILVHHAARAGRNAITHEG
jgi:hypothetical protein